MPYIIGIILACIAIYLIIQLIIFISPIVAGVFMLVLVAALIIGFIRGAFKGFVSYYGVLTDVYGQKVGRIIGVLLTVFWLGCVLLLGWNVIQSVGASLQDLVLMLKQGGLISNL